MARETIRVEGLKECEEAIEELMNTVGVSRATGMNTVKRALIHAGQPIATAAAASVKVRKGQLKATIGVSPTLTKRQKAKHTKVSPVEVYVGAGPLPQAHMQEFGSANNPPKRFLQPAVDQNIRAVADRFATQLKEEIEKTAERARRKQARLMANTGR